MRQRSPVALFVNAQAVAEFVRHPAAHATVTAMTARAAAGLAAPGGFLARVGDRIAAAAVAGFDEIGLRAAGRLARVHVARTETDTLITCHARRGREGIDAGVLGRFSLSASTSSWAA